MTNILLTRASQVVTRATTKQHSIASASRCASTTSSASLRTVIPSRYYNHNNNNNDIVQEFHNHFWKAAALRSLKREPRDWMFPSSSPSSSLRSPNKVDKIKSSPIQDSCSSTNNSTTKNNNILQLRQNARQDLFKHFRMKAGMRAMKRGDGVFSKYFSLPSFSCYNDTNFNLINSIESTNNEEMITMPMKTKHVIHTPHYYQEGAVQPDCLHFLTLIDVATANKAREDFRTHFWRMHRERMSIVNNNDAKNDVNVMKQQEEQADKTIMVRSPSSSSKTTSATVLPTSIQSNQPQQHSNNKLPLPTNLSDAYIEFGNRLSSSSYYSASSFIFKPRAMAVTEKNPPFKIVDVNKAWIDLCGYTKDQAVGSTLKELLQGPETNLKVAESLVSKLVMMQDNGGADVHSHVHGNSNEVEENEAVLINYRSDGRKFRNHVRVGPLKDEVTGEVTHFVGVFRQLSDDVEDEFYANV